MQASPFDELAGLVRARMDAAQRDKAIYERNGARLDSQILQGELNMGAAVLGWIDRLRAGSAPPEAEDEDEDEDEGEA